jgi:hypothetical protein
MGSSPAFSSGSCPVDITNGNTCILNRKAAHSIGVNQLLTLVDPGLLASPSLHSAMSHGSSTPSWWSHPFAQDSPTMSLGGGGSLLATRSSGLALQHDGHCKTSCIVATQGPPKLWPMVGAATGPRSETLRTRLPRVRWLLTLVPGRCQYLHQPEQHDLQQERVDASPCVSAVRSLSLRCCAHAGTSPARSTRSAAKQSASGAGEAAAVAGCAGAATAHAAAGAVGAAPWAQRVIPHPCTCRHDAAEL